MKSIVAFVVMLTLAGCSESAQDYAARASAQQTSNNLTAAETTLKEGIEKHPHDDILPNQLMMLYIASGQEENIRRYLGMGGDRLGNHVRANAHLKLRGIAQSQGRIDVAWRESLNTASALGSYVETTHDSEGCAIVASLYGDAIRDALKLKDTSKTQGTINQFQNFRRNSFCREDTKVESTAQFMDRVDKALNETGGF